MGIVNVTPDSFFAAARTAAEDQAIARGNELFAWGCDIVDVGGESTRPGAHDVPLREELQRVLPVVSALASRGPVSIDTRKPEVARAAVSAGAVVINDVSGALIEVAGELGVGYVAMHSHGTPQTMQIDPHYDDVLGEVLGALEAMARRARHDFSPAFGCGGGGGGGRLCGLGARGGRRRCLAIVVGPGHRLRQDPRTQLDPGGALRRLR